jgi:ABC-type cobalamin/Fe3+-siderophores transport system ATPase subunit
MAMMLRELVVEDLFGEFTHPIPFKTQDGLTLLHGPNGVGKTMTLRALDDLFNKRFHALRGLPLRALHVEFDNGDRLQVSKAKPDGHQVVILEFILNPKAGRSHTWTYKPSKAGMEIPLSAIDELIPELARTAPRSWTLLSTGETLDLDEVLDRFSNRLPVGFTRDKDTPDWLNEVLSRVPVYFIQADRLSTHERNVRRQLGSREYSYVPTVTVYAGELSQRIQRTLASYADSSQTLDSTFPARLLQPDSFVDVPTDEEIRERYAKQAERRNRYVRTGLLDAGDQLQLPDRPLNNQVELRVLDTYLKDVDLKLDRLDDLAGKLELFLSIINGKFRRKEIRVDREHGLVARTSAGQKLELTSLSSGEQQEIVLAYGLLFRERPGTLILLDEPELSLHVSWQLDLIPDLLKIADVAKLEFLIATHSPQIVNDRWDLTVQLSDDQFSN